MISMSPLFSFVFSIAVRGARGFTGEGFGQRVVERVHSGIVETAGDGRVHRHIFHGLIEKGMVALELLLYVTHGVGAPAFFGFV